MSEFWRACRYRAEMVDGHALIPMLPPGALSDRQQVLRAIVCLLAVLGPLAAVRVVQIGAQRKLEGFAKVSHFLPATLQCLIFAYWSLYYRRLSYYVPLIGLELVYAYLLEGLVSLSMRGKWRVSAAPLPVVFSTNLFVLFLPGQVHLTLAAISLALLSKVMIVRDGRHVVNPSAFGIAIVGLLTMMFPELGYGDTAREFNLPPNMTELVILLGLIVQTRLPIVMTSVGCFVALHLWQQVVGVMIFSPWWAPVALVIVLLVTDPATVPRTPKARLLYGLVAGLLMEIFAALTTWAFAQDFYAKVMCVPFANALVPQIEALAARLPDWRPLRALEPRWNLAHVALWVVLMAGGLASGQKQVEFTETNRRSTLHQRNQTPHIQLGGDGRASCSDNPMWCEAFSFAAEWQAWRRAPPQHDRLRQSRASLAPP